jgi:hypothetical protein
MTATGLERKDIFDFMIERIDEVSRETNRLPEQAFVKWFVDLYFGPTHHLFMSDGSSDGKVDGFFKSHQGDRVVHHVVNSKFTRFYSRSAPSRYYDEVARFASIFANTGARSEHLAKVKAELRPHYKAMFEAYDEDRADLIFLTDHTIDEGRIGQRVKVFQLDDLLQCIVDDVDGAMPRTEDLVLYGINSMLATDPSDSEVPMSIAFARLIDFTRYMVRDPFDLLFARNVRVAIPLSQSEANRAIRQTFQLHPKQFVYSNNGITVLCEKSVYTPGAGELRLLNPRVVNGSQTLHSIRDVDSPSPNARVMVRIIEVPPLGEKEMKKQIRKRRDIIDNITTRSNQQNPVKRWTLVSNDDFQMDLYRFFRRNDFFYERREREWNQRSRELRSVGVTKGPGIKKLAQLIASYHCDSDVLGPARAKLSVGKLFEERPYEMIRKTSPRLALQLYVVSENVEEVYAALAARRSPKYFLEMKGHANLTVFALVTKVLSDKGARWDTEEFTNLLFAQWECWPEGPMLAWRKLVEAVSRAIHEAYRHENDRSSVELTMNNFFKTDAYVSEIFRRPTSRELGRLARSALRDC